MVDMQLDKRNITWNRTDSPLVSERVKIILSNEKDANALADAVRRLRRGGNPSFELSKETTDRLEKKY